MICIVHLLIILDTIIDACVWLSMLISKQWDQLLKHISIEQFDTTWLKRGRFLPEVHLVQFGVSIQVHETVFRHDKFNTTYDLQKLTLNIHNLSLHEEILSKKLVMITVTFSILWCASLQFPICWINNYHDIDGKEMKIKKPEEMTY